MRVALCLCLVALATPALAGERPRVALLELQIEGDAPPEVRAELEKNLAGGLYLAGFEVVRLAEVQKKLRAAPELAGCTSTNCLERIGSLVNARRFARAINASNKARASGRSQSSRRPSRRSRRPRSCLTAFGSAPLVCAPKTSSIAATASAKRAGRPAPA